MLEAFEGGPKVSPRVERLCRAIVAFAHCKGIDVSIMSRNDVRACFVNVGAKTRHEIATAVATSFEVLRSYLPQPRRAWDAGMRTPTWGQ